MVIDEQSLTPPPSLPLHHPETETHTSKVRKSISKQNSQRLTELPSFYAQFSKAITSPPAIQTAQELNKTLFYKQATGGNLRK